jgi:hypothetical protein
LYACVGAPYGLRRTNIEPIINTLSGAGSAVSINMSVG